MAEKNDDIKNLFLNLGLNPGDYHEIRTAPTATATVGEAPRRWSLLQAAPAAAKPQSITPAAAAPAAAAAMPPMPWVNEPAQPAVPAPAPRAASPRDDEPSTSLSAVLLAAAQDIARAEATGQPFATHSDIEEVKLPAALSGAFSAPAPEDGLQSLFQSVKEPQTASVMPSFAEPDGRTEQIGRRIAPTLTPTARAASLPTAPTAPPAMLLSQTPPRLVDDFEEPVTRHAPPPMASRLGPVPTPAPLPVTAQPPSSSAAPRLRFGAAGSDAGKAHGDSLQDVFRRLARDNRA